MGRFKDELSECFQQHNECCYPDDPDTRLDFIGSIILGFDTYDSGMSELMANECLEVIVVLLNGTNAIFIDDKERYKQYLLYINTTFLSSILNWGTSIRGASIRGASIRGASIRGASIRGAWIDEYLNKEIVFPYNLTVKPEDLIEFLRDLIEWSKEVDLG